MNQLLRREFAAIRRGVEANMCHRRQVHIQQMADPRHWAVGQGNARDAEVHRGSRRTDGRYFGAH